MGPEIVAPYLHSAHRQHSAQVTCLLDRNVPSFAPFRAPLGQLGNGCGGALAHLDTDSVNPHFAWASGWGGDEGKHNMQRG